MIATMGDAPPFPDSLCHGCTARRYVTTRTSTFVQCTALPVKYPRQPVVSCAAFDPAPVVMPINGTLDLHTVRPDEIGELLPEYLRECAARGVLEVRVVHGKGTGALRRMVHALLSRSPLVAGYRTADEAAGGWGATLVTLRPARS
jgi:DNA-nicking Smr family endonuclease